SYCCQWSGCCKHFKQRQKLERHMKSHSCYKGFQCSLCSKCFSTSDILHQHKR
ncbi:Krueppel-like factor 15, partial [Hanseniaspora valbyensis NRRL Y-1626]